MKYNFDEHIDRNGTDCVKYDSRLQYFGTQDLLPMWVADMDFKTPPFIVDAVQQRAAHAIYGYTFRSDSFFLPIVNWMRRRHDWHVQKEWITFTPGVVPALVLSLLAYTQPGDKVIVQPPVYFPFFSVVKNNGRQLVYNSLKLENNKYVMDFDDLERKIDYRTKLLFFCSPQNPTGRVWTTEELDKLAQICIKHNLIVISDEIHADLVYKGFRHIPLASLNEQIAKQTITLMAPSKTFNIPGLYASEAIIPNHKLLNDFNKLINNLHIGNANLFGLTALEAAYNFGAEWLDQMLHYLGGNLKLVKEHLENKHKNIELIQPEGTYLLWLDFKHIGLKNNEIKDFLIKVAKVGFNDGAMFGPGGEGFQRMNIGAPRQTIQEALHRIDKAMEIFNK